MLATHQNHYKEVIGPATTPILRGHSLLRKRRNMAPTDYARGDEEMMDREYQAWLDAPLELGPMRIPWSPLGDSEHDFSYATVCNLWTATTNTMTGVAPLADLAPARNVAARNNTEKKIQIHMRVGPVRPSARPNNVNIQPIPNRHRVHVTGLYYDSYESFHNAKPSTTPTPAVFPKPEGLLGQFTTTHNLTPTTTWDGLGWAIKSDMTSHSLPESFDLDQRLVMGIYAVYWRDAKKAREMVVMGLPKEGFQEGVKKVVDQGIKEIKVLYYLKTVERVRFVEESKGEEERDRGKEAVMKASRTPWNPEKVFDENSRLIGKE